MGTLLVTMHIKKHFLHFRLTNKNSNQTTINIADTVKNAFLYAKQKKQYFDINYE